MFENRHANVPTTGLSGTDDAALGSETGGGPLGGVVDVVGAGVGAGGAGVVGVVAGGTVVVVVGGTVVVVGAGTVVVGASVVVVVVVVVGVGAVVVVVDADDGRRVAGEVAVEVTALSVRIGRWACAAVVAAPVLDLAVVFGTNPTGR